MSTIGLNLGFVFCPIVYFVTRKEWSITKLKFWSNVSSKVIRLFWFKVLSHCQWPQCLNLSLRCCGLGCKLRRSHVLQRCYIGRSSSKCHFNGSNTTVGNHGVSCNTGLSQQLFVSNVGKHWILFQRNEHQWNLLLKHANGCLSSVWPRRSWSKRNWPDILSVVISFHFRAHEGLIGNNVFWIELICFKVFLEMLNRQLISSVLNNICSCQRCCTIIE